MRDRGGAEERVDLLQQATLVLRERHAVQARAALQQLGDAADLALDSLAARLGGVGGEDRAELQAAQQREGLAAPALVDELAVGDGDVVDGVLVRRGGDRALAGAQ